LKREFNSAGEITVTIGYGKPLYVLPFDHRATFSKNMFGWQVPLSPEQTAEIAAVKQVIYDGFKAAVAGGVPKDHAGILVDEQFGAAILRDAHKQGFITSCPAEKSGQAEFDFEYGADFARHIEQFNPTFCKVLVRYNPEGDKEMNRRQAARLKQLSDFLHQSNRLYMFELLVPAEPAQRQRLGNDKKVRQWLTTATGVPGFIGFAVGRTVFWDPLIQYRANKITRDTAVAQIAASYRSWVDVFEKAR
jgi:myo-inositol catabolism protein IolC